VFGLGADVIAGFPGETEDDHAATLSVVRDLPFTSLHVFPYSIRPGTPAEKISGKVEGKVIARRARELRDLAGQKADQWRCRRNGQLADVVVTTAPEGRAEFAAARKGLTEDYVTVAVSDASLERGTRFDARLSLVGDVLTAVPLSNY
jgi:threonylcarbamoyladenosine tRNA methylthiotransferase MtaB